MDPESQDDDSVAQNRGLFLKLATGIMLLLLVIGSLWLAQTARTLTAPIDVSDKFVRALLNNDTETAYNLTNQEFKNKTSREEFNKVAASVSKGLDKQTLKTLNGEQNTNVDGSKQAEIYYEIKDANKTYNMTVKVVKAKNSNQWLILSVDNTVIK